MKKYIYILLACAAVFSFTACIENVEINPDENSPVLLNVSMEQPVTKATIGESDGVFKFSNGDAIKVYNGTGLYTGMTSSTSTDGTFAMEDGFVNTGSGFAGFPASLVSNITDGGVTFVLPSSYEYDQVGSADPDAAKVPCPMMGTFTAGSPIQLMQAGAVVRIRVTNIAAGDLSFTFPTFVAGTVTVASTPAGDEDGILVENFTKTTVTPIKTTGSKSIIVHGVPAVSSGSYIYITLPVPTKTDISSVLVTNDPSTADTPVRMGALSSANSAIERAKGWRFGVSPAAPAITPTFTVNTGGGKVVLAPGNLMAKIGSFETGAKTATASNWKFGGYFEIVGETADAGNYLFITGSADCVGKWVDLFAWQGANATVKAHGLVRGLWRKKFTTYTLCTDNNSKTEEEALALTNNYYGALTDATQYSGCWDGLTLDNSNFTTWRMLSNEEWHYIREERGDTDDYRFARAQVSGVNGLLIFPDGTTSWNTTWGPVPADKNGVKANNYDFDTETKYTAAQMVTMANAGVVFLPCTGYMAASDGGSGYVTQSNYWGYYWTSTGTVGTQSGTSFHSAYYLNFNPLQSVDDAAYFRHVARAVRLARDAN